MMPIFCLRLASGLAFAALLLPIRQMNPRFFRAHFLAVLGLTACSGFFLWPEASMILRVELGVAMALSFLASLIWTLDRSPGARWIGIGTACSLVGLLISLTIERGPSDRPTLDVIDNLSSAGILGTATTAMVVGHSYLTAPAMSIKPLTTLLAALGTSIAIRLGAAGFELAFWTRNHSFAKLDEITLFVPVRWLVGLIGPAVLTVLAWQTAKIRSTQSATGILYVVVIFCFLGELISQVLLAMTGFPF
jgi:hypothetical protein